MKSFLIVAILATVVGTSFAGEDALQKDLKDPFAFWYLKGTPNFDYDCTGHADGNYPHPTKCTHYVACVAQSHAYEMSCALNHDGNPLHYVQNSGPDPAKSYCDYPEVAGCVANPGRPCNDLECWNEGYCRNYTVCDNGQVHNGQCEDDLWWNPGQGLVSGHLTGQCDSWDNLDEATQDKYKNDEDCIPPCAWWAKDDGNCGSDYVFREPFVSSLSGREHDLSCSAGLVWAQDQHNCVHCSSRQNEDGSSCCGGSGGGDGGSNGSGGDASGRR